jgi:hypothetical protein
MLSQRTILTHSEYLTKHPMENPAEDLAEYLAEDLVEYPEEYPIESLRNARIGIFVAGCAIGRGGLRDATRTQRIPVESGRDYSLVSVCWRSDH